MLDNFMHLRDIERVDRAAGCDMPVINAAGLALIKEFEGCSLKAYPDPASGGEPYTIGYGHTSGGVYLGMTIDQESAEVLLQEDLRYFEQGVSDMCARALNSNQFSALVSFAFNLGLETLRNSTLMYLVNQGEFEQAALEFTRWVYAGSPARVIPGLVRRREAEQALFKTPTTDAQDKIG